MGVDAPGIFLIAAGQGGGPPWPPRPAYQQTHEDRQREGGEEEHQPRHRAHGRRLLQDLHEAIQNQPHLKKIELIR